MSDQISQLYDLKIVGATEMLSGVQAINKSLAETKRLFIAAKEVINKGGLMGGELVQAKQEAERLRVEMLKLTNAQKEGKNETIAYKTAMDAQKLATRQAADAEKQAARDSNEAVGSRANTLATLMKQYNNLRIIAKNSLDLSNPADTKNITDKLNVFKKKIDDFNRGLSSNGTLVGEYSSGILQAFKKNGLDELIKNQIDKTKAQVHTLDSAFEGLKQELASLKATGVGSLESIEARMVENRTEAQRFNTQLSSIQTEMHGMGSVGSQVVNGFKESFKDLKGQFAQLLIGYVGFQAAMGGIHHVIDLNKELSDSYADLQIRMHGNKEEADGVVTSLKTLNTRTNIGELVDTASLLAKKGVAKEEITSITKALDDYFVVAGKEAGNRGEGTASIVKLISIFNDDKHVTKGRVEEISAALIGLQNSGVATGSKMIDLAERIGSVRGLTGVTLPNVLGLAAAVEQLGQKTEVGGTAGVQILSKMLSDVPKYAGAAGMSIDSFRKLLKDNPIEALVRMAQNLTKSGEGFEKIATDFEEVGVKGARVKAFLADVGTNGEYVIKRMKDASVAMKDTASVALDATIKQDTLAATVAKIGNAFDKAFSNPAVLKGLSAIATSVLWVVTTLLSIPFAAIVVGLGLGTAAWAILNKEVVASTIAAQYNSEVSLLGLVRRAAERVGILATTVAVETQTVAEQTLAVAKLRLIAATEALAVASGAAAIAAAELSVAEAELAITTGEAAVAMEALDVATSFNPLGLILTAIALLIPFMSAFGASTKKATDSQDLLNETIHEGSKLIATQSEKVRLNTSILNDSIISDKTKDKALKDLIALSPDYLSGLTKENIATDQGREILDRYNISLKRSGELKASQAIVSRESAESVKANMIKQDFEQFKKSGDVSSLTDEEKDIANSYLQRNNRTLNDVSRGLQSNDVQGKRDAESRIANILEIVNKKVEEADKKLAAANENVDSRKTAADAADKADKQNILNKKVTVLNQKLSEAKSFLAQLKKEGKDNIAIDKVGRDVDNLIKQRDAALNEANGTSATPFNVGERTINQIKADLKAATKKFDTTFGPEKDEWKAKVDALTQELITAGGKKGPHGPKGSNDSASDTAEKLRDDQLKLVDDAAAIQKNALDSRKTDEESHAFQLNAIIQNAAKQKLEILKKAFEKEKDLTAKQKEDIKLKQSEIIKEQFQSNKDSLDKGYDFQSKGTDETHTSNVKSINDKIELVQANTVITNEDRANQIKKLHDDLITEQFDFNIKMGIIEIDYGHKSAKNEQQRGKDLKQLIADLQEDTKRISAGRIKDIQAQGESSVAIYKNIIDKTRQDILDSKNSPESKNAALDELDRQESIGVLKLQIDTDRTLIANDKLTGEERLKVRADYLLKQRELAKLLGRSENERNGGTDINPTDTGSAISKSVRSLFKFNTVNDKDSSEVKTQKIAQQKLFGETVDETYKFAGEAMSSYFDSEKQAIENSLKMQEKQLDVQKRVALGHAQSAAEKETIERQFEVKKQAAAKVAFEKNKKMQIAQAEVNLAMQLSNIAVVAFAPTPPNIATMGAAGIAMYAIQAALAVGSFALNVSKINAAQFAGGGIADVGNGKITHTGNIPTKANGDNIFATVKTGEVILNEKQQAALGGPSAFAAIGVPGFAMGGKPGGFMSSFAEGGYMGSILQPPVFRAYYQEAGHANNTNVAETEAQMKELRSMITEVGKQVYASDAKRVHVVSKDITSQQGIDRKNASIGRL